MGRNVVSGDSSVGCTNKLQQAQEDLDDVDVDGERCEHILLWTDRVLPLADQQLCVVRQKQCVDYCANGRVHHVKPRNIFEGEHNGCDDACHHDNDPQDTE